MSQSEKPRISVLMPCYNSEETLEDSIRSVLAQTEQSFELLILDDGSKDRSVEIAKRWEALDPRVKSHQNPQNLGLMKTLNRLWAMANGEYLARLDSDDEMLPRRLEVQSLYLDNHPDVGLVGSQYYHLGRNRNWDRIYRLTLSWDEIKQKLPQENQMAHSTVMMRKSVMQEMGGYRDFFPNSEDYDLWLRISKKYKIVNLEEPLVRIRLSLGGATLGRRFQMAVYQQLAVASFHQPHRPLPELLLECEAQVKAREKEIYSSAFYRELIKSFLSLGHWSEAWKVLVTSVRTGGLFR